MRQTLRDRIHQWMLNLPYRYSQTLRRRAQERARRDFQQDY